MYVAETCRSRRPQRYSGHGVTVVDHDRGVWNYFEHSVTDLERPGQRLARALVPEIDAVVLDKVLRPRGNSTSSNVIGGCECADAVRRELSGDQAGVRWLTEADRDVDPFLKRAFDERIWAAVHTLRALSDKLAEDSSITLISGALADRPNAYGTAIMASESAAMEAFGRGLAFELAPRRVNAPLPAYLLRH